MVRVCVSVSALGLVHPLFRENGVAACQTAPVLRFPRSAPGTSTHDHRRRRKARMLAVAGYTLRLALGPPAAARELAQRAEHQHCDDVLAARLRLTCPVGEERGLIGAPARWPPQLGRAPLRLGRHEAEPSGQDFHRSVDVRRAERARVRRRPRRVRAAACNRRRPALGLPHRRWS